MAFIRLTCAGSIGNRIYVNADKIVTMENPYDFEELPDADELLDRVYENYTYEHVTTIYLSVKDDEDLMTLYVKECPQTIMELIKKGGKK